MRHDTALWHLCSALLYIAMHHVPAAVTKPHWAEDRGSYTGPGKGNRAVPSCAYRILTPPMSARIPDSTTKLTRTRTASSSPFACAGGCGARPWEQRHGQPRLPTSLMPSHRSGSETGPNKHETIKQKSKIDYAICAQLVHGQVSGAAFGCLTRIRSGRQQWFVVFVQQLCVACVEPLTTK